MKHKFLIASVITLLCFSSSFSQVKAYAYKQIVLPGNYQKGAIDEKGNEVARKPKQSVSYFFYLEYKKTAPVVPTAIWFKDQAYSTRTESVEKLPVEMINNNIPNQPAKTILVPATPDQVISVRPDFSKKIAYKPTRQLRKLLADSEVVFVYICKGKRYYKAVKKITMLEPVATQ